jgi:hypothetical protein
MPTAHLVKPRMRNQARYANQKKGRNNEVSALFHVNWQAVTGCLPTFRVVPDFLTVSVTPPPE